LANGLKNFSVAANECQEMMSVRYVGLGTNPFELTPEESHKAVRLVKIEAFGEIYEHFDLPRRQWSLKHARVDLGKKGQGNGFEEVPLIKSTTLGQCRYCSNERTVCNTLTTFPTSGLPRVTPVHGRELHPLESSAFHGALLRQLMEVSVVCIALG
jgi:hypothetical protein